MGRRKKPTQLKVVAGTDRKDRQNPAEPEFAELKAIDPPAEIAGDDMAVEKWRELAPALAKAGVLKVTDKDVLVLYCVAHSRYWKAQRELDDFGITITNPVTGMPSRNPAAMILSEAYRQMTTAGSRLGLDPASRQNIAGKDKSVSQNRWAEFD